MKDGWRGFDLSPILLSSTVLICGSDLTVPSLEVASSVGEERSRDSSLVTDSEIFSNR
jgi:hypothetical protein